MRQAVTPAAVRWRRSCPALRPTLGERVVDCCQRVPSLSVLALLPPSSCEAHGRTQFPRLAVLPSGDVDGVMEAHVRFNTWSADAARRNSPLKAMELRLRAEASLSFLSTTASASSQRGGAPHGEATAPWSWRSSSSAASCDSAGDRANWYRTAVKSSA